MPGWGIEAQFVSASKIAERLKMAGWSGEGVQAAFEATHAGPRPDPRVPDVAAPIPPTPEKPVIQDVATPLPVIQAPSGSARRVFSCREPNACR